MSKFIATRAKTSFLCHPVPLPKPSVRRFAVKKWAVLFALCLVGSLLLGSCGKPDVSGKGFRFPLAAEPKQLDPQVSTDTASVTLAASLFEGLTRLDENGDAVPAAADWAVSDDGLTYTFTLRKSAWSDGTPVIASDFVFGMQRTVSPSTKSALSAQLDDIRNAKAIREGKKDVSQLGVKAVNESVLTITLEQPHSDFPVKAASTPFMPCQEAFFESTGGRYGLEAQYVLTNGPFYLKSWSHGEWLLLNKHEGYHDAASVLPAAVRYMIGDVTDAVSLLTEGQLDAAPLGADQLDAAQDAGLTLVKQQDSVRMLWLNNSVGTLANSSIRQALRDGLEWTAFYEQFQPAVDQAATGFIAPDAVVMGSESYRTSSNAHQPASLGREAAQTLAKGLGEMGLEAMPALTVLCADDDYQVNLARYIVQSWQKNLSLYFQIEKVSESELMTRVKVGNYQIALAPFTPTDSEALETLRLFVSGTTGNLAKFSDKTYDKLYASASTGSATRSELEQMEALLWKQCASIPLSFVSRYVGIPANDSGIIVRPFNGGVFGAPYDFRRAGRLEE